MQPAMSCGYTNSDAVSFVSCTFWHWISSILPFFPSCLTNQPWPSEKKLLLSGLGTRCSASGSWLSGWSGCCWRRWRRPSLTSCRSLTPSTASTKFWFFLKKIRDGLNWAQSSRMKSEIKKQKLRIFVKNTNLKNVFIEVRFWLKSFLNFLKKYLNNIKYFRLRIFSFFLISEFRKTEQ